MNSFDIEKKIHEISFKNLYLAAGNDPVNFKDIEFFRGVVRKVA